MKFDSQNTDIKQGFAGFEAAFKVMADKRTRARTSLGGKTFEAFGMDMKEANNNLERKVREAVESEEIILNAI